MSKKRYVVLGLGQFGKTLAVELCAAGCEVLAVDRNPKLVEMITSSVTSAAVADVRDKEALREILSTDFDAAICAMGNSFESCILATLHLKEIGFKEVYAEAADAQRAEVLLRVGASRVVSPERDQGRRLAQSLATPNLLEFIPLTEGYGVVEVEAPKWTLGNTLGDLDLRNTMNVAVIAIRDVDGVVAVVPGAAASVSPGDRITLVGRDSDLNAFQDRE